MSLTVKIITPERSLPVESADHVTLPAFDGEVGIRAGHAPMVTMLGIGDLHLKSDNHADKVMAVKGGVAQVLDDEVIILAQAVMEAGRISEDVLLKRIQALLAQHFEDTAALNEARAEAHWLATQLKAAGKQVPDLSKLGI